MAGKVYGRYRQINENEWWRQRKRACRARIVQALGRCIRTGNNVSAMSGGGSERELAVRRE